MMNGNKWIHLNKKRKFTSLIFLFVVSLIILFMMNLSLNPLDFFHHFSISNVIHPSYHQRDTSLQPRNENLTQHEDKPSPSDGAESRFHSNIRETEVISQEINGSHFGSFPPQLMEDTRKHIARTANDLRLFLEQQMKKIASANAKQQTQIMNSTLEHVEEYHRVIDVELQDLNDEDGWKSWRIQEERDLSQTLQTRLYHLQNPQNCSAAPVLLCDIRNPYGFASGLRDVLWCFINAYHSREMLVLMTSHWSFARGGWEKIFLPLSNSCSIQDVTFPEKTAYPGPIQEKLRGLFIKLPRDLGPRLLRIHDNPLAWWYGQFIHYLMRPNKDLQTLLDRQSAKMDSNSNTVGLHIRRSDKVGKEAQAHAVEEYMHYATDYFREIELKTSQNVVRQVYVATDDPSVSGELKSKYPTYKFFDNPNGVILASNLTTRYSNSSLYGLLVDVFMLARSDFIVCTFSSGLCALAYELMQALHGPDASHRVQSLDVEFNYAWVSHPLLVALYSHQAKNKKEISFRKGDVFYVNYHRHFLLHQAAQGKKSDGFAFRWNKRTGEKGYIPLYKTKPVYEFEDFPLYDVKTRIVNELQVSEGRGWSIGNVSGS